MSYRPLVLAAVVAALSSMRIASADAQSVYVAPGGVYVAPGAGPVYVAPPVPTNGAAAYVEPGYGHGYGTAAYVEPADDYGYGPDPYVEPRYGYGPGPYVAPRYGYGYGPRPYVAPRYGYGYGPAGPHRRYYSGPGSAYATALPPRPRVAVPYRTGRCGARHCY
jgi:hypothetical protein